MKLKVDSLSPKRSWLQRFAARIVARMIVKSSCRDQYDAGWSDGKLFYASRRATANWVLRQAGYRVWEDEDSLGLKVREELGIDAARIRQINKNRTSPGYA